MKAEEYQQIKNKIYNKFPTGIDYIMLEDVNTLWENLSEKITIPDNFDSENAIHKLNIQATQKHLIVYKIKMTKMFQLLDDMRKKKHSKVYMKKLNNKIYNLSTLINDCRDNIKMSSFFIDQKQVDELHLLQRNVST